MILDNLAVHKSPVVRAWQQRHPRVHFHFTPTYTFQYDTKGRVTQVTVPTGGSYTYAYTAIDCADGSTRHLERTINPGDMWIYDRVLVGSIWKTTVKAPALAYDSGVRNEALVEFTNGLETKQTVYQGAVGGTALLATVSTNTTIGTAQVPNSRTVILPNNLQSKVTFLFDSFTENGLTRTRGNLKEINEYGYGQGAPPATHTRKTTLGYLHESQSAYAAKNIVDRISAIQVYDSGGAKKAETLISYDQGTLLAVGGAANHDYTNFPTTYTTRGNPTTIQRWVIGTTYVATTETYDELGNVRTVNDSGGHQTNFDYADFWENSACLPTGGSALAFPTTITNPLGHSTTAKYYSCTSQLGRATDPNNQITTVAYADALSRPTQTSFPDGGWITLQYADSTRTVTATQKRTDTANVTVIEAYNQLGALSQRQLPGNRKVDITYDALGRVWKVSNPYVNLGEPTSGEVQTQYDALGRVKKAIKQDGTFAQVDYASNATQITDEAGKKRQMLTDGLGRVTKVCEVTAGNARSPAGSCGIAGFTENGYVTTNTYDVLDNLTQTIQGSQTRTMSYDGLGRITAAKIIEVSTGTNVTYGYDADGNRTSVADPRGTVNLEYDPLHRLTKKKHGTTIVAEYTYDGTAANNAIGRLITETDGPVGTADKTDYTYDAMGRVKTANRTVSGTPYNIAYEYDYIGNLTKLTYPSGRAVEYAYNAAAELTTVRDITGTPFNYVTGASYSPLGTLQQLNLINQVSTTLGWNNLGRLSSIQTQKSGSPALLNLGYTYHANGQIQQITNNLVTDGTQNEKYTYDDLLRLLTAQRGPDTSIQRKYSYDYDRFGNRWGQILDTGQGYNTVHSFNAANNRVTSSGFVYDNGSANGSGNLTANGPGTSYTYNPENFMTGAGASVSYQVDTLGRRTKKTVSGTTTDYFYSGSVVISEKQGTTWTDYIFFGNQRIAKQTGSTSSTATYIHPDHLGSTRVCTDANGNPTGTCDYEPFGESQSPSGCSLPTTYRFAGMEFDSETGLYHTWFRQYDPSQGRWMSVDPLPGNPDDPQSLNRYVYVLDDPVNLIDPLGLECWDEEVWVLVDVVRYRWVWVGTWDDGRWEWERYVTSEWQKQKQRRCGPERDIRGTARGGPGDQPKPQPTTPQNQPCPPVPPAPPRVDINENIATAEHVRKELESGPAVVGGPDPGQKTHAIAGWFFGMVMPRGPWDYKRRGGKFEAYGNFNYAATGAAAGFSLETLQRAAGAVQISQGRSQPEWGWPWGGPPYGDDPRDQANIAAGFQYYQNDCHKR